jgi:peptidoglycan/xylan/chitin deacetylase (PgdA/CDA1 family)
MLIVISGLFVFGGCDKRKIQVQPRDYVVIEASENDTFASLAKQYLNDPQKAWMISEYNRTSTIIPGQKLTIPLNPFNRGGLYPDGYQLVPVLCYSELVYRNESDKKGNEISVYEQQMEFLKKNGYNVISMARFIDFINYSQQIPEKSVVITIDDNSSAAFERFVPLLHKYGYAATLFFDSSMIGKKGYISMEQLKSIVPMGIDIGSRSGWSIDKNIEEKQIALKDYILGIDKVVKDSKSFIEKETGGKCIYYALPPEGSNNLLINILKKEGYKVAFNQSGESNPFYTDSYNLNRIIVPSTCTLKEFEAKLIVFRKVELK